MKQTCEHCDEPAEAHGWCKKHYTRWLRHGDPLTVKQIVGDDDARYESKVDRSGGPNACHPWTGAIDDGGYGSINIGGKTVRVHQYAWRRRHGAIPPGSDIDHECHNRALEAGECHRGPCPHRRCCNEAHIKVKTRREHVRDTPPGEHPHGEENGKSVLTADDVREIRRLLAGKTPWKEIAGRFGVSIPTVGSIKRRRTWAWLELLRAGPGAVAAHQVGFGHVPGFVRVGVPADGVGDPVLLGR